MLELWGGFRSGSLALLSDAGHMVADASALILSLLALWFAGRPADLKRSYGYYRMEILSALANGVVLLGITGGLLFEAYHRFLNPRPIELVTMGWVTAVGLVANLIAMASLHRSQSINVRGAFLHVLGDALSSVGVLTGAGVIALTGWSWVDPLLSCLIAVVIVYGAWGLTREAVDVLLEAVPAHVDVPAVRTLMGAVPGVVEVHDLHIWTLTSGVYSLSAHLVVEDPMTCNNDVILSAVKHELLERFGIDHTTIQIESEAYAHAGEVH